MALANPIKTYPLKKACSVMTTFSALTQLPTQLLTTIAAFTMCALMASERKNGPWATYCSKNQHKS